MLETFLNVVPITIIVGIIYVIYRIIKIKKNKLSVNYFYEIVKFIFVCFLKLRCLKYDLNIIIRLFEVIP